MYCRRAAGLSFLQINELAYYFSNCLLAQLTLWGTSSPGMNRVKMIWPSSLVQAYLMLFLLHVSTFCLYVVPLHNPNLKYSLFWQQYNTEIFLELVQGVKQCSQINQFVSPQKLCCLLHYMDALSDLQWIQSVSNFQAVAQCSIKRWLRCVLGNGCINVCFPAVV